MPQREPPAHEGRSCERLGGNAFEDHLGVAFIQPGGSRYEQMKVAWQHMAACNKGGTAFMELIRPLQ